MRCNAERLIEALIASELMEMQRHAAEEKAFKNTRSAPKRDSRIIFKQPDRISPLRDSDFLLIRILDVIKFSFLLIRKIKFGTDAADVFAILGDLVDALLTGLLLAGA